MFSYHVNDWGSSNLILNLRLGMVMNSREIHFFNYQIHITSIECSLAYQFEMKRESNCHVAAQNPASGQRNSSCKKPVSALWLHHLDA